MVYFFSLLGLSALASKQGRDQGPQAMFKARYGSTLSSSSGMRGDGGHSDKRCNGTSCLSAGFPSPALCFRAPALSGVYGLALSPRPICHVHHASLVGSSCGTSSSRELVCVSPRMSHAAPHGCMLCLCSSSPCHPSACGLPCLQGSPRVGGILWRLMASPRDTTSLSLFVMQEGDGAKPKTLSSQKLSPKWCFLDCGYHPPLDVLTVC